MNGISSILIIDCVEDNFHAALNRGYQLANCEGAELHILSCRPHTINKAPSVSEVQNFRDFHHQRKARLEQIQQEITSLDTDIEVTVHDIWKKKPANALKSAADILDPDIVIKAFDATSRDASNQLITIDQILLRVCPVPFLLIHNSDWQSQSKLLAALDLQETNLTHSNQESIFKFSHLLNTDFNLTPTVVSTFLNTLTDPEDSRLLSKASNYSEKLNAQFNHLIDQFEAERNFKFQSRFVEEGSLEERVANLTQDDSNALLIIGNYQRHGLNGAVRGNAVERIMQRSPCEVLVLPVTQV